MRTLARNMTLLMQSIVLGKEKYGLPEKNGSARTSSGKMLMNWQLVASLPVRAGV